MPGIKTTYYVSKNDAIIRDSWILIKEKLKENFHNLSEKDLSYKRGRENELILRLQCKLGKTETEVRRLIADSLS